MDHEIEDAGTQLAIRTADDGIRGTIALEGELDIATSPRLLGRAAELVDRGVVDLELDLGRVEFVDSTGLSAIIELGNRARQAGGVLRTSGLSPAARRILELTGVIDHLRHHEIA